MSLKKKAAQVRAKGKRNIGEDSILAHISPKEARLLKMRGGSGRRDPNTGLPHFDEAGDSGGGGLDGAPDSGTIGGGGYGTSADGMGFNSFDANRGYGGVGQDAGFFNGFDGFSGWGGLGYGDSDLGGFNDVNGFASPAQATGWDNAMSAQDNAFSSPFTEGNIRKGIGGLASVLGGPVAGLGVNAGLVATSKDPGRGFGGIMGSTLGGLLGSAVGGPLGGWAGSSLGGMLGGKGLAGRGASGADAAAGQAAGRAAGGGDSSTFVSESNRSPFDLGGVLTGLAGIYQGNQASNTAQQSQQMAQSQATQLADLYGPNSPYAQQLRQQLERKDAAGGRRSQYGPREVELQARLADIASRNAPNVLNANKQAYEMGNASNKVGGQQLASLFGLADKTGLTGYAQRGLNDLFNGGGAVGATNGLGGFSEGGTSFNNPSAYTTPDSGGNFWDRWL